MKQKLPDLLFNAAIIAIFLGMVAFAIFNIWWKWQLLKLVFSK